MHHMHRSRAGSAPAASRERSAPAGCAARLSRRVARLTAVVAVAALLGPWSGTAAAAPRLVVTSERLIITEMPRGFANVNLMVMNVVRIKNEGDAPQPEVELPLAAGYQGLQVQQGAAPNPRLGERSLIDPQPLRPGQERQYAVMYGLGYPRLPNFIDRPILYPTQKLSVVTQAGQFAVEAPGLRKMGRRDMNGTQVEIYDTMSPLSPSPGFAIKVLRGEQGINPWFWAWVALFTVPALGLIAIAVRGRRVKAAGTPQGSAPSRVSKSSPSSSRAASRPSTAPRRSPAS